MVGFPACITGHMTSIQGGLHPGGLPPGGLPPGGLHPGGRGLPPRGLGRPPAETRKASGTHPTGMLSC